MRGYGQKDPRVEYEKEAYEIFEDLKSNIADEAVKAVFASSSSSSLRKMGRAFLPAPGGPSAFAPNGAGSTPLPDGSLAPNGETRVNPAHAEKLLGPIPGAGQKKRDLQTNRGDEEPRKPVKAGAKVGRNELCPCGSGKKYKRCHGTAA